MTPAELTEIESTLAQHRATLRTVGNAANMQAASEELLDVAAGLVAEVRRLNGLIEQCKRVFTWKHDGEHLYSLNRADGSAVDGLWPAATHRGLLWQHLGYSGYFDTPEEARDWVENRLRRRGVIKTIDVVEVAK